jgi:hypothetical protein
MMRVRDLEATTDAHRGQLLESARSLRAGRVSTSATPTEPARQKGHRPAARQRIGTWLIHAGTRLGGGASISPT